MNADDVLTAHEVSKPAAANAGGQRVMDWVPTDLTDVLNGDYEPPFPEIGTRTDGVGVFYANRVHSVSSESEAGKTWLALIAIAAEIRAARNVVYLDFEDDVGGVVGRLLALGADTEALRTQFVYIRPETAITESGNRDNLLAVLEMLKPSLVVLDGITEAMTLHGLEMKDNSDIATFGGLLPRWIAQRGPAVVNIDHFPKDRENRGRYAIGGVHKLNAVNGAAYTLENRNPLGIGLVGRSTIYIAKDRPGQLRKHALPSSGGRYWFADLVLDSTNGDRVIGSIAAPVRDESPFRPTIYMQRISETLERSPGPLTQNDIEKNTDGKCETQRQAIRTLIDEGYITTTRVGRSTLHTLARPFTDGRNG